MSISGTPFPRGCFFPDWAEESERRKRGERGPQKAPVKAGHLDTCRQGRKLAKFKATGSGWQTRMNVALRSEPMSVSAVLKAKSIKKKAARKLAARVPHAAPAQPPLSF